MTGWGSVLHHKREVVRVSTRRRCRFCCAHVRAQWLERARNFEKYHRACLDDEARAHLKQRIAKLEAP